MVQVDHDVAVCYQLPEYGKQRGSLHCVLRDQIKQAGRSGRASIGYSLKQELAPHFIPRILSELKQKRNVLEIGRAQLSLGDDREIPTMFLRICPGSPKLWLQLNPMLEQIASVLDLDQKWPPVPCQRKISSVEDEEVRCVSTLFTVDVGVLYCQRLLFMLENILVEDQMLDEVALQA